MKHFAWLSHRYSWSTRFALLHTFSFAFLSYIGRLALCMTQLNGYSDDSMDVRFTGLLEGRETWGGLRAIII